MVVWLIDSLLLDQIAGVWLLFGIQLRLVHSRSFIFSICHPATWPVRVAADRLESVNSAEIRRGIQRRATEKTSFGTAIDGTVG